LAKRSLGLEVPEPVQLADPLIEEALRSRVLGGDRKIDVAGSLD
jgi:hypothetical protein